MTKSKLDLARIAAVCLGCICLFVGAFIVIGNLVFAQAISGTTTLQPDAPSEAAYIPAISATQPELVILEEFAPVDLTVMLHTRQSEVSGEVPESALTMNEAAQIGARYIYDVFEHHIEGFYVEMTHLDRALSGLTRTTWNGFATPMHPHLHVAIEDLTAGLVMGSDHSMASYTFVIDALTGERLNILRHEAYTPPTAEQHEAQHNFWRKMVEMDWFAMSLAEQQEMLQIDDETHAAYMEQARQLADRHFEHSYVVEIAPSIHNPFLINGLPTDGGEIRTTLTALLFDAVDSTGRMAQVHIQANHNEWFWGVTAIATSFNDMLPLEHHPPTGDGVNERITPPEDVRVIYLEPGQRRPVRPGDVPQR